MHPLGGNTDQAVETFRYLRNHRKKSVQIQYIHTTFHLIVLCICFRLHFFVKKHHFWQNKNLNNLFVVGRSRLSHRKPARRRRWQSLSFWMLGISWTQIPLNASFVEGYCQSQLSWERVLPYLQAKDFPDRSDGRERCLWIYKSNENNPKVFRVYRGLYHIAIWGLK